MSGVDYETMKQLLDDQSRTILSEIKSHVKAEVTAQLGPHVSRVDQLYDDQAQIRKQLSDITTLLKNPTPSSEVPTPATTAPSSPFPSDHQHLQHLSNHDIENITSARHKLHFSPISTDDLERLKNNPSEDVSLDELLNRALHEYLEVNMGIPTTTIVRMDIKQINHGQEILNPSIRQLSSTLETTWSCMQRQLVVKAGSLSTAPPMSMHMPNQ